MIDGKCYLKNICGEIPKKGHPMKKKLDLEDPGDWQYNFRRNVPIYEKQIMSQVTLIRQRN